MDAAASITPSTADANPNSSTVSGSSGISNDLANQLLASLNNVNTRLDGIDRRVQRNEETVATRPNDISRFSTSSPVTSPTPPARPLAPSA